MHVHSIYSSDDDDFWFDPLAQLLTPGDPGGDASGNSLQNLPDASTANEAPQRSLHTMDREQMLAERCQNLPAERMPAFSAAKLEDLEEQMFDWAYERGFALKVRASKNSPAVGPCRRQRHTLTFQCIKGNQHIDKVDCRSRKRAGKTGLTACPYAFRVRLVYNGEGDNDGRYLVTKHCKGKDSHTHNHPTITAASSVKMRRLPAEVVKEINDLARAPGSPIDIHRVILQRHPHVADILVLRDIYRLRKRVRAEETHGLCSAQHLLEFFRENAVEKGLLWYMDQRADDDTLHGVLWSTTKARALLHRFPTVLAIDVTYNVNRHGHKLLHISGVTATNQSFTTALAAMADENEDTITRYLKRFVELMGGVTPAVVVTDRAQSIRNAVAAVWDPAHTKNVFCSWHILENLKLALTKAVGVYRAAAPRPPRAPGDNADSESEDEWSDAVEEVEGYLPDSSSSSEDESEASGAPSENSDAAPRSPRPSARNRESFHVVKDGRILTKTDWDDVKDNVRQSYDSLVIKAKTVNELKNGLETWTGLWLGGCYGWILLPAIEKGQKYARQDGHGFIHCFINEFSHFNQRTTSRLEGLHASLRYYVGARKDRRYLPIDKLVFYSLDKFATQFNTITDTMDRELNRRPAFHEKNATQAVKAIVSEHALYLINDQLTMADNLTRLDRGEEFFKNGKRIPRPLPCTGHFRTSVGCPCAHDIHQALNPLGSGAGVLELHHFHDQWLLASRKELLRLENDLNDRITNGSGLFDINVIDRSRHRRLRDPVSAAARSEATQASQQSAGGRGGRGARGRGSQRRSRGLQRPRGPQTSSGRLLTQAEIAEGHVEQPVPRCTACQRAHDPLTHPCSQRVAAATAVRASQRAATGVESSFNIAENAENAETDEDLDYDTDFDRVHPRFLAVKAADCDECPICSKNHKRRWCRRMCEWKKWYPGRGQGTQRAERARDRREQRRERRNSEDSPQAVRRTPHSEVMATLRDAVGVVLEDNDSLQSVPATPTRAMSPTYRPELELDSPSDERTLFEHLDWWEATRTQRLGSVHHEYERDQPSQDLYTPRQESMVPETQLGETAAERAFPTASSVPEVAATPSGRADTLSGPPSPKRPQIV